MTPGAIVDCDAHIWETDATWSHLRPSEQAYRPEVYETMTASGVRKRVFMGRGWQMQHGETLVDDSSRPETERELYPAGVRTLTDVPARLRTMDEAGVDVQICHPTGWTHNEIDDPDEEASLARSYNRWMAEATAPAAGRLRWQVQPPMATPTAVVAELEWCRANGAVGIHLQGFSHGKVLTDKSFFPVWEAAEALDLTCVVHVGQDARRWPTPADRQGIIWNVVSPVPAAFFHLLASDFNVRFPRLRWAFVEAGAMWLPWVLQRFSRAGGDMWGGLSGDWRQDAGDLLAQRNLWLVPQADDDIGHLIDLVGHRSLVLGTGYGHFDMATDPHAHRSVLADERLSPEARTSLTSSAAFELFPLLRMPVVAQQSAPTQIQEATRDRAPA